MITIYFAQINSIPREWKEFLREITKGYNLQQPPMLSCLYKCKKGTKCIRHIWTEQKSKKTPIGQTKWDIEFTHDNALEWKFFYNISYKCKLDPRTRFFNYQVLHRSLMNNTKLHQFNLRNDDQCDTCGATETIPHLLYDCQNATNIWHELGNWLSKYLSSTIHLDKISVLLGNTRNEYIVNALIITRRYEIYKCKCKDTIIYMLQLKNVFKGQIQTDIYLGTIKKQMPKVLGKWSGLYNVLKRLLSHCLLLSWYSTHFPSRWYAHTLAYLRLPSSSCECKMSSCYPFFTRICLIS